VRRPARCPGGVGSVIPLRCPGSVARGDARWQEMPWSACWSCVPRALPAAVLDVGTAPAALIPPVRTGGQRGRSSPGRVSRPYPPRLAGPGSIRHRTLSSSRLPPPARRCCWIIFQRSCCLLSGIERAAGLRTSAVINGGAGGESPMNWREIMMR